MKTIKRHTRPINDCDIQNGIIDVLGMNYSGNQLVSVSEGATLMPEMGYAMGEHDGGYAYDANGNMTTIGNNSISLAYNFLNLPGGKGSESDDGVTTPAWTYSADGVKLKYENKDYVAGIEYKDGELYCIHHAEGRIFPKEQTPAEQASNAPLVWDYNFYLRDHLGNTRIVTNGFGIPVQENNYYPFGMNMDNIDAISDNTDRDSRYTYNGKEMNADLGMHDYGARFYDPSICRFTQIDPLTEAFSSWTPYHYTHGNPIRFNDPTGLASEDALFSAAKNAPGTQHVTDRIVTIGGDDSGGGDDGGGDDGIGLSLGSYSLSNSTKDKKDDGVWFEDLWKNYTKVDHLNKNGAQCFNNQCAIRVSHALIKSGIQPGGVKCWSCSLGMRHSIRATELAEWLVGAASDIKGISKPAFYTGDNYFQHIRGKQGIVYFENYWARNGEVSTRTGDHIDLWWGKTMKASGSIITWGQRNIPWITEPLGRSNLQKAERVIFWEVRNKQNP